MFKDLKTLSKGGAGLNRSYVDFFHPTGALFESKLEAKEWIALKMIPDIDERMGCTDEKSALEVMWEDTDHLESVVNDWMVDNQMFLMEVKDETV